MGVRNIGKMKLVWFRKNKFQLVAIVAIVLYLVCKKSNYDYAASVVIAKVHPVDTWEFVADFSNMKFLNPTIVDFNILSESGNYEHWTYFTEYWEHLSHWPYLSNVAIAHFEVTANPKKDEYFIHSTHSTCLLFGIYCLDSVSEFKFSKPNSSQGTLCEETIQYQCPRILSPFCRREVAYQRNVIMTNLQHHFNK